jgi:hypothetical protein
MTIGFDQLGLCGPIKLGGEAIAIRFDPANGVVHALSLTWHDVVPGGV